ncbi:MAG: hypothetical protein WD512_06565 [Candidatus Paceibacterota bacterium]
MKVRFLLDSDTDVFAFFPEEPTGTKKDLFMSYAHIGQHSDCHSDYAENCNFATEQQYKPLLQELISIGYDDLEVQTEFFKYDNDEITITYLNYGAENRNLGELFDWLGDVADFIQINELYQFACSEDCGNIFDFTNEDENTLAKTGSVTLKATGKTVGDFKETHEDTYKWFFNIV